MSNWDIAVARRYHELTKHSYESVRSSGHRLEWDIRPHPYKEYPGLEPEPLPRDLPVPDVPALTALAGTEAPRAQLDLAALARLLRSGAGVSRRRVYAGGEGYDFRTYSSAGALYPVEVYVATPAGLFHFHPRELALRRVREEDVRGAIAAAAASDEPARAGAVLLLSGILWRTAWKYQARGYRHLFWDAGTMLANLLALAASGGLAPRLFTGFVDHEFDRLLGLDGRAEAALALLTVGEAEPAPASPPVDPLALETAPLSSREVRYPLAEELHAGSRLADAGEVGRYRRGLPPPPHEPMPPGEGEPLEPVLKRRVSVRGFALEPVPAEEVADLFARALGPVPSDVGRLVRIAVIVNAVDGFAPGVYAFDPPGRFELVRAGELRRAAAYLALEQVHAARAAATVFLMADLDRALDALGNRGYRAAQLEAGIVAGRLQVGAFALGWGATASTFYDDDVTRAVAPDRGDSPMLCVAIGRRPPGRT